MFSRRPRRMKIAVRNRGVCAAEAAAVDWVLPFAFASPRLSFRRAQSEGAHR
jgi:hypothetical protein